MRLKLLLAKALLVGALLAPLIAFLMIISSARDTGRPGNVEQHLAVSNRSGEPGHALIAKSDFMAFYGAAWLVKENRGSELYNLSLQSETQSRLASQSFSIAEAGRFNPFAYPPYVAFLISPLSCFSIEGAFCLQVVLMLFLTIIGGVLLWLALGLPTAALLPFLASVVVFPPHYLGMFKGQLNGLLLLAFSGFVWSEMKCDKTSVRRDVVSGVFLGLLFIKPQYLLLPLLYLLLRARVICALVVAGFGFVFYLLGSLVGGWDWPIHWLTFAHSFAVMDQDLNGYQMISLAGFIHALVQALLSSSPSVLNEFGSGVNKLLGLELLSVAIQLLGCVILWRLTRRYHTQEIPHEEKTALLLSIPLVAVLSAGHALFYDALLLFLPISICFSWQTRNNLLISSLVLSFSLLCIFFKENLCFQPLAIAGIIILWMIIAGAQQVDSSGLK